MACTTVLNKTIVRKALPTEIPIFTTEDRAIYLALDIISKSKDKKFIIFSNSLSVLRSLSFIKLEIPLIIKLLSRLDSIFNSKEIIICWIPSHIRVRGNKRANSVAKTVLDVTPGQIQDYI